MNLHLVGHGIEITPALRSFTEEKFQKLERHFERLQSVRVIYSVEKLDHFAEATLQINQEDVHASANSVDLYTSVDELVHKLDAQLSKQKNKYLDRRDHRDHPGNEEEL